MRVAVLCDVHGNLPALEAVLAEVASLDVDRIVCGGDVVAGPFPRECLERLLGLDAVFVRGNGDRTPGDWVAERLDPLTLEFLRELPIAVSVGGDLEHAHVQYDRVVGGIRLVNAGSVGRPYEGRPGAFWALLDGEDVDLRHTPYAVEAAAVAVRASGYPAADDVASALVDPEDPDEVSVYFESLAS